MGGCCILFTGYLSHVIVYKFMILVAPQYPNTFTYNACFDYLLTLDIYDL